MTVQPFLDISQVTVAFGRSRIPVLNGIELRIARGEYVSVIGHSGCGKSTLLNVVAGLLPASCGGVLLEGREVDSPGPDRAVVFQNHSLLPWLTCYENVKLAVDQTLSKAMSRAGRHDWTMENIELVRMGHAKDRLPGEVSGGMKQRIGIARALAMQPKVLLLDEPFGALDALTRAHLQDQVAEIHARLNTTVLMITHDVDEAVLLSDRIVMMTNGPEARVAEVIQNTLPKPRTRADLHHMPGYHPLRDHIMDFLITRSRTLAGPPPPGHDPRHPPVVRPADLTPERTPA